MGIDVRFVSGHDLTEFATTLMESAGLPKEDATLVADSLVQADLWGHSSHGVLRLGWYYRRLTSGVMKAVTRPELIRDSGPVAVVDGHDGVGQVLAALAIREGISRARRHGVAAVGVRNSNHFGTAAYFTRMAPAHGCIAMLTTNSSPAMAPWGGRVKAVGANPWSIAVPAGKRGVAVMDIANTAAARGKLYAAQRLGAAIPLGWALDTDGESTTDPTEGLAGMMLPMAAHKGYVVAVMMDILSGVLTGSEFGLNVNGPYQHALRSGCGHLAVVLWVEAFLPLGEFNRRVDRLLDELTSVSLAPGFDAVLYPGEREERAEYAARQSGVALSTTTLRELRRLAEDASVATPAWLGLE